MTSTQTNPTWRSNLAHVAWAQTLIATTGSLYFSEVMRLPPCSLCWYQRIFMYPLVFVLAISIASSDARLKLYALPFAITGWLIAAYHNLLYYKIIPEGFTTCVSGVSCTSRQIEWLGFITIPLMSLMAFTIIVLALIAHKETDHKTIAQRIHTEASNDH
jgi:disulfide bond formation protein DsbB